MRKIEKGKVREKSMGKVLLTRGLIEGRVKVTHREKEHV